MADQNVIQILRDAPATDAQRDTAYSAYSKAKSWDELKTGLDQSGLPPQVKISLARAWAPVAKQLNVAPVGQSAPSPTNLSSTQSVGTPEQVPTVNNVRSQTLEPPVPAGLPGMPKPPIPPELQRDNSAWLNRPVSESLVQSVANKTAPGVDLGQRFAVARKPSRVAARS